MSKILTAEEFAIQNGFPKELFKNSQYYKVMIKFAKLHVKATIKECIESAPSGSSTDTVSYEDVVKALKDCYPLTNIK